MFRAAPERSRPSALQVATKFCLSGREKHDPGALQSGAGAPSSPPGHAHRHGVGTRRHFRTAPGAFLQQPRAGVHTVKCKKKAHPGLTGGLVTIQMSVFAGEERNAGKPARLRRAEDTDGAGLAGFGRQFCPEPLSTCSALHVPPFTSRPAPVLLSTTNTHVQVRRVRGRTGCPSA